MGRGKAPRPTLTVKHPYAQMLVDGEKREEYRSWEPTGLWGMKLWIHAAKAPDGSESSAADLERLEALYDGLYYGAIIGSVVVASWAWDAARRVYRWAVTSPRKLKRPIEARGALGIWYYGE